jgi:general nucleoside transport system ATP-binding protein
MAEQTSPQSNQPPLIAMRGISKAFPGVKANVGVDLDIYAAEIHALLGENGAGKSTLMKILYGFYRADSGTILHNGNPIPIRSPHNARAIHMGMVFQEFTLIPAFTVAENIALFLPDLGAVPDAGAIHRRILDLSARYDLRVSPQAMVSQLSVGEQQKVEILKLLLADARLLILDEPTRVLAPHEVQALFRVLDRLRSDGYAIILITHKLKEVLDCADRITVLRGGHAAGTLLRAEASESRLVGMMFGKEAVALQAGRQPAQERRSQLLELRGVETRRQGAEPSLKAIDLEISSGEIVGVAGVSGNGQKELTELLLGMIPCARGKKLLFGSDVTNLSVRELRGRGVAFIPENPLTMATAPFMTVLENMAVTQTRRYARWGGLRIDWQAVRREVEEGCRRFGFSFSLHVPAKALSGGNLQRMVIVREMMHGPHLIVASYLTRGLDVQSTTAARQSLVQARDGGAGVLLISEDLEELFLLSDRLVVLVGGGIVGSFLPGETDIYRVGQLMTGAEAQHDSAA